MKAGARKETVRIVPGFKDPYLWHHRSFEETSWKFMVYVLYKAGSSVRSGTSFHFYPLWSWKPHGKETAWFVCAKFSISHSLYEEKFVFISSLNISCSKSNSRLSFSRRHVYHCTEAALFLINFLWIVLH